MSHARPTASTGSARSRRIGCSVAAWLLAVAAPAVNTAAAATPYSDLHNSCLAELVDQRAARAGDGAGSAVDAAAVVAAAGLCRLLVLSFPATGFDLLVEQPRSMQDFAARLRAQQRLLTERDGPARLVLDRAAATKALRAGATAVVFAVEGLEWEGCDATVVDTLHAAGVRVIGPLHGFAGELIGPPGGADRGPAAAANHGPRAIDDHSRLTERGLAVVERCFELGITVDVAHAGRAAFWQIAELNRENRPIITSHANARALCDEMRNLDDEQLRYLAATGGVVGVCLHAPLLVSRATDATVSDVIDHVEHLVKVMGQGHVAIGSDWGGRTEPPANLASPGDLGTLVVALREKNWTGDMIDDFMWRNALRCLPSRLSAAQIISTRNERSTPPVPVGVVSASVPH